MTIETNAPIHVVTQPRIEVQRRPDLRGHQVFVTWEGARLPPGTEVLDLRGDGLSTVAPHLYQMVVTVYDGGDKPWEIR